MTQEQAVNYMQLAFEACACVLAAAIAYRPLRALPFLFGTERVRRVSDTWIAALRVIAGFVAVVVFGTLCIDLWARVLCLYVPLSEIGSLHLHAATVQENDRFVVLLPCADATAQKLGIAGSKYPFEKTEFDKHDA